MRSLRHDVPSLVEFLGVVEGILRPSQGIYPNILTLTLSRIPAQIGHTIQVRERTFAADRYRP
jgi:hypothetical protein